MKSVSAACPCLSASELQRQLASGRLTSRAATEALLSRIERLDDQVQAFVCLNDRALREADAAGAVAKQAR